MRLTESMQDSRAISAFLIDLYNKGIQFLHVSDEYPSYALLCDALRFLKLHHPTIHFSFMVKLGEPHFDHAEFSTEKLDFRIKQYCAELSTNKIHTIQWMWRHNVAHDSARIDSFTAAIPVIRKAVNRLKDDGKINQFFCFPYSAAFASLAIQQDFIDGLAVYYNPLEGDYVDAITQAKCLRKKTYSIRPFAAGKLFEAGWDTQSLIDYTFKNPGIQKVIFTATKKQHIESLYAFYHHEKTI